MAVRRRHSSRKSASRKSGTRKSGARKKTARKRPAARKTATRKKSSATRPKRKAAPARTKKKPSRDKSGARRRAPARKSGSASARAPRKRAAAGSTRPFRLAPEVRPHEVDVHVDVDPSRSDAFRGEVGIAIEVDRRRRSLELHAADLRVSRARLRVGGDVRRGRVVRHPEKQTIEIQFEGGVPAGASRLELAFGGKLRRDLCGLYGVSVGKRRYAFTQLEAADARKFFPCFDEPGMKARFRMSVTTGEDNAVVSNAREERTETHEDGTKTVHFARTPRLSSYLIALAVGDLERSAPSFAGETEIRVWHVPGKGDLADFALDCARETLTRLERYFDLPYPYDKLDLVAVPDFEFGAMENAGAVFFRETLLLVDPASVTLAEKKRAAEVICHELAHMWYGDLVTMAWWDDLWLNEAFATWMAFAIVDQWQPDWKMWHDFQHHRAAALDLDALRHTHPIYTSVRTPDEANENFDLITYEKGASVVRMTERYLGEDRFREGVRTYIRRHREGNAVAADLWNALSEASGERVEPMVRAWVEQEGYPVVALKRVEDPDGGCSIEMRQERFYENGAPKGAKPVRWPIPWVGRIGTGDPGTTRTIRHLLTKKRERVPAKAADLSFFYGNADEGGFFRPQHTREGMRDLLAELDSLTPVERMGLTGHQWALVRAGRVPIASLLDLVSQLGAETDPDVLAAARAPLVSLATRLAPDVGDECEARLRAWVQVYFGAQADELGWDAAPGESDAQRLRRALVIDILGGVARASAIVDEAGVRCRAYLDDRSSLDPDLTDAVTSIAAANGDAALYDAFLAAMRSAHTPQEQRRFLMSLCDFSAPELIDRTLDLCVGGEVATQDVAFVLVRLLANRPAREPTWRFVRKAWPKLRRRMAPLLAARFISATPLLGSRAHRREVAAFFRANPVPAGSRALRQALERFDGYDALLRREGRALFDYVSGR